MACRRRWFYHPRHANHWLRTASKRHLLFSLQSDCCALASTARSCSNRMQQVPHKCVASDCCSAGWTERAIMIWKLLSAANYANSLVIEHDDWRVQITRELTVRLSFSRFLKISTQFIRLSIYTYLSDRCCNNCWDIFTKPDCLSCCSQDFAQRLRFFVEVELHTHSQQYDM